MGRWPHFTRVSSRKRALSAAEGTMHTSRLPKRVNGFAPARNRERRAAAANQPDPAEHSPRPVQAGGEARHAGAGLKRLGYGGVPIENKVTDRRRRLGARIATLRLELFL